MDTIILCVAVWRASEPEREKEAERGRDRERQRDRETERRRDGETERRTDGQTDTEREREGESLYVCRRRCTCAYPTRAHTLSQCSRCVSGWFLLIVSTSILAAHAHSPTHPLSLTRAYHDWTKTKHHGKLHTLSGRSQCSDS